MILIGVCGYRRSGKNSVCSILTQYGFKSYGFADALRKAAAAVNPLISLVDSTREACEALGNAQIEQSAIRMGWRYNELIQVLGYERAKDEVPDFRRFLQKFGTDACRETFGPQIWVEALDRTLEREQPALACISDVRFRSEADYIKAAGGVLWRVNRPGYGGDDNHPSERDIPNLPADWELTATNLQELEQETKSTLIQTLLINYDRGTHASKAADAPPTTACCGGGCASH